MEAKLIPEEQGLESAKATKYGNMMMAIAPIDIPVMLQGRGIRKR